MTKQILIPSALLLASGCTTSMGDFASDDLSGVEASSKDIVELPPEEIADNIEEMIEPVLAAFASNDLVDQLVEMSYALPQLPEMNSPEEPEESVCGETLDGLADLQILEQSGSRAIRHRWGWEMDVTDCEIGDESFSGVMRFTYEEVADLPGLFRREMVEERASHALWGNAQGHSSLRYELDVSSDETHVYVTGTEFGPEHFLAVDSRAHIVDLDDMSMRQVDNSAMVNLGGVAGGPVADGLVMQDFRYSTVPNEIALEDGDVSRVTIGTEGLVLADGDEWPHRGVIEGVIRGATDTRVAVRFTDSTPLDGTVEVLTNIGPVLYTLPMD